MQPAASIEGKESGDKRRICGMKSFASAVMFFKYQQIKSLAEP